MIRGQLVGSRIQKRTSCRLELKPEEVMMCAAHSGDRMAARSFGLLTGFIHRPNEYGPTRKADDAKPSDFDVASADIMDLATQLGA